MAKEFLQSLQDLFVNAHKQNSNVIFCYPSSKQLCKSIKSIQWIGLHWLPAGLISHTVKKKLRIGPLLLLLFLIELT